MSYSSRPTFFQLAFGFPEPGSYNECRRIFHQSTVTSKDPIDNRPVVSFRVPQVNTSDGKPRPGPDLMMPTTQAGSFYTPSVRELREETAALNAQFLQEHFKMFPSPSPSSSSPSSAQRTSSDEAAAAPGNAFSIALNHIGDNVVRLLNEDGLLLPTQVDKQQQQQQKRNRSNTGTSSSKNKSEQDIVYIDVDGGNGEDVGGDGGDDADAAAQAEAEALIQAPLVDGRTGQPIIGGAVFQAASQFNCLEMVSPGVSPERGVEGYEFDNTQGPKCAMACAAGIVYRNYLVPFTAPEVSSLLPTFARALSVSIPPPIQSQEVVTTAEGAESQQQPDVPMPSMTSLVHDVVSSSDSSIKLQTTNTTTGTNSDCDDVLLDISTIDVRRLGQMRDRQINCFTDVAVLLNQHILGGDGEGKDADAGAKTMFTMQNGYLDVKNARSLRAIHDLLVDPVQSSLRNELLASLRIGVHRDSEITSSAAFNAKLQAAAAVAGGGSGGGGDSKKRTNKRGEATHTAVDPDTLPTHVVTQTYNSALGVAYSKLGGGQKVTQCWAPLATLVLAASYEATLLVAVQNNLRRRILKLRQISAAVGGAGNNNNSSKKILSALSPASIYAAVDTPCYLTALGGGVFGNEVSWIAAGILEGQRNVEVLMNSQTTTTMTMKSLKFPSPPLMTLDTRIVHFRSVDAALSNAMKALRAIKRK